jgi:hypothetical protein
MPRRIAPGCDLELYYEAIRRPRIRNRSRAWFVRVAVGASPGLGCGHIRRFKGGING